jgi:hypothetical protein
MKKKKIIIVKSINKIKAEIVMKGYVQKKLNIFLFIVFIINKNIYPPPLLVLFVLFSTLCAL